MWWKRQERITDPRNIESIRKAMREMDERAQKKKEKKPDQ